MRVTVFSDLHVHNYSNFDKGGSRLEECLKVLDDVFKFSDKNDIRTILFVGDIVDQQKAVPTVASNALMGRLGKLFGDYPHIGMFAITGNHDQATKSVKDNAGVSYLTQLELAFPDQFCVIDDTYTIVEFDFLLSGIPYYEHPEHYHEMLERRVEDVKLTDSRYKRVLMIHQTPSGLGNPNIPIDTNVSDRLYDNFDLVLCGHIHKKQKITDKFYLIGSPLHRDLGDEGDDKGFWVFDTEDPAGTMEFISRKGRYPEFKRISGDIPEDEKDNYVIPIVDFVELSVEEEEHVKEFSASLGAAELMENYCKQSGEDDETLKIGLKFIN